PDMGFSLKDADVILVSLSFETDFIHLVEMMWAQNVEGQAGNRQRPYLIVGGAFPTMNPEIFRGVCDLVLMGEFELYLSELFGFCEVIFSRGKTGKDGLEAMAEKSFGDLCVHKDREKPGGDIPLVDPLGTPNYSHIVTPQTSFSNMFLVEITRGCRFRCRFCSVPSLYGKTRIFPKEKLLEAIELGLVHSKKVGLVSALSTQYPHLIEISRFIMSRGAEVSFSSLRIEEVNDELLHVIKENGQNILTLAPEVGSPRLIKKIRKATRRDKLYDLVEKAIGLKFKKLKLYFMIGFEEEDEEDLDGIVTLVTGMRDIALKRAAESKYMPEIILSVNQFIPKTGTELGGDGLASAKDMKKKLVYLKKKLLPLGNISVKEESYKENYLQWRLSHGSMELGEKIALWIKEGARGAALNRLLKENE
ncbi:MAG: B12-binding domain-containing radical SAM protein, partial [Spirochaetota bacterium]|nr:B12-binding domain-containing radical SAM protein [Spirochaetota bacterium]